MRSIVKSSLLITIAVVFSFLAFASVEFSYAEPRPMLALCSDLSHRLGVLITYEDAPYNAAKELTTSVLARNGNTVLTPKWQPVRFQLMPGIEEPPATRRVQAMASDDVVAALADLTTQYNESGNPGRFSVKKDGRFIHVQQTLRMIDGTWTAFAPISDTVLAWRSEPKSCYAVLGDLSNSLAEVRGFRLAMGSLPMGTLLLRRCDIQNSTPTMGEVLDQVMKELETNSVTHKAAIDYGYTWDLVYDPNWNKYFLSIDMVREEATSGATGPTMVQAAAASATPNAGGTGSRLGHH